MRVTRRGAVALWVLIPTLPFAASCAAGADEEPAASGSAEQAAVAFDLQADLAADVKDVQDKVVALAEAMSDEQYTWRPMEGVRSVGEVFMHIAADNYFLAIPVGISAPAATGITMDYGGTVVPYETRPATRSEIIEDLKASYEHLRGAMDGSLAEPGRAIDLFGRPSTVGSLWLTTATHMHEHLGQSIAYARANGVVPPWSR